MGLRVNREETVSGVGIAMGSASEAVWAYCRRARDGLRERVLEHLGHFGHQAHVLLRLYVMDLCCCCCWQVGKLVMRAAADTLTPVVLELGGKDAVIITEDADLERVGGAGRDGTGRGGALRLGDVWEWPEGPLGALSGWVGQGSAGRPTAVGRCLGLVWRAAGCVPKGFGTQDADLERAGGLWEGRGCWEAVMRRLKGAPAGPRGTHAQGASAWTWIGWGYGAECGGAGREGGRAA